MNGKRLRAELVAADPSKFDWVRGKAVVLLDLLQDAHDSIDALQSLLREVEIVEDPMEGTSRVLMKRCSGCRVPRVGASNRR